MKIHSWKANCDTIAVKIPIFQSVQAKEQQDISFASRGTSTSALSTSIALNNSSGKFIIGLGTLSKRTCARETCSTVESLFFPKGKPSLVAKNIVREKNIVYWELTYGKGINARKMQYALRSMKIRVIQRRLHFVNSRLVRVALRLRFSLTMALSKMDETG